MRLLVSIPCLVLVLSCAGCSNFVITGGTSTPPPSGPPPSPTQGGTITLTPQYAAIAPGQSFKFAATTSSAGTITWKVNDAAGGTTNTGIIDNSGNYTAPPTISHSVNIVVTAALAQSPQTDYATAVATIIQPGVVSCPPSTGNPQVAQYSIDLPSPGNVFVQFGKTTDYGLDTWAVPTPSTNGGQVKLWVAGMLGKTLYHMRAQVALANGATFTDADQTCTTGTPPVTSPVSVSAGGAGSDSIIESKPRTFKKIGGENDISHGSGRFIIRRA